MFSVAVTAAGHNTRQKRYAPARNHHHLLQDTLVPSHYDLRIRPDIYQEKKEDFIFDGNVTIHFKCRRSTNRIKLHATGLEINQDAVRLTGKAGGEGRLKVASMDKDEKRSFVDFHLNKRLRKGRAYTIDLPFSGVLNNGLKGLYFTSYYSDGTDQ
jgi:hypothetical protein